MPIERVSKGFKDLSMTFQANPVNFDLIATKNETVERIATSRGRSRNGFSHFNLDLI